MLVLVLNALMPLAAQAMAASTPGSQWQEICTSTGMVRLPLDDSEHHPADSGAGQSQDCPYCNLHAGHAGLPPAAIDPVAILPLREMPPAFFQAAHTSSVWLAAQSRAPPSLN